MKFTYNKFINFTSKNEIKYVELFPQLLTISLYNNGHVPDYYYIFRQFHEFLMYDRKLT